MPGTFSLITILIRLAVTSFVFVLGLVLAPLIFSPIFKCPLNQNFYTEAVEFPLIMAVPLYLLFAIGFLLLARPAPPKWVFWVGFISVLAPFWAFQFLAVHDLGLLQGRPLPRGWGVGMGISMMPAVAASFIFGCLWVVAAMIYRRSAYPRYQHVLADSPSGPHRT